MRSRFLLKSRFCYSYLRLNRTSPRQADLWGRGYFAETREFAGTRLPRRDTRVCRGEVHLAETREFAGRGYLAETRGFVGARLPRRDTRVCRGEVTSPRHAGL